MENFGAYLKAHREKKGIRLEEIASITKIHPHSLELLENNKWEQLPPEPFIRGFILAYAKYVGLGTTEVLDKYREATGAMPVPVEVNQETATIPGPSRTRPAIHPVNTTPNDLITQVRLPSGAKMITAASLIAVVGLAALLINVGRDAEKPAPIPTVVTMTPETPATPLVVTAPEETRKVANEPAAKEKEKEKPAKATAVAAATPAAVSTTSSAVGGTPAHEVVVEGKERTWMKVVIDDSPPQEIFLGEGKSATYKAMKKIKVVLGNSTGSRVVYNGKEQDGTQFMGTIRYYKFPSNARFPQDVPSKRTPTAGEGEAKTVTE
jgi:cytoskeleton protein RodZ